MKSNQSINNRINDALASIDGIERAEPKPFLFTRVMAKMQATKETVWEKASGFISRPSFAIAGLSLVIVLNIMVITARSKENKTSYSTDTFSLSDMAIDNITNTNR